MSDQDTDLYDDEVFELTAEDVFTADADAYGSEEPTTVIPGGMTLADVEEQMAGDDWCLDRCERVVWHGRELPAIGGIPLVAKLGKGGMGHVYRGIDPVGGGEVAVKVLPESSKLKDAAAEDRFLREAQLAAELGSEHVVRVLHAGEDAFTGAQYLVMECVRGISAREWLATHEASGRDGVDERLALEVCIASARGLVVAHDAGVIHRDLKPGNILLPMDGDGNVHCELGKLADLGLARATGGDENLTATATALGTAGFMAPEQLENAKESTPAVDLFGLGATLYALLTGVAPFAHSSSVQAILNTINVHYAPVRELRADVSRCTAALVARCLQKDPLDRYADARALLGGLETCRAALDVE
jgi:serine/threonine-protein kinase